MAVEMAIWRMTDDGPQRLPSSPLDLEQRLEDMLAEDPCMTGIDLLVVGRQVRTAYGGGTGYVGIGRVTGEMIPAREARVEVNGELQPLLDQPELSAAWWENAASEDPELTEMVVPVQWLATRSLEKAFRGKGLFASQLSACKLRDEHTITAVESAFGLGAGVD